MDGGSHDSTRRTRRRVSGGEARILTREDPDLLKIPGAATFCEREGWSVFIVDNGRACQPAIQIGDRNQV